MFLSKCLTIVYRRSIATAGGISHVQRFRQIARKVSAIYLTNRIAFCRLLLKRLLRNSLCLFSICNNNILIVHITQVQDIANFCHNIVCTQIGFQHICCPRYGFGSDHKIGITITRKFDSTSFLRKRHSGFEYVWIIFNHRSHHSHIERCPRIATHFFLAKVTELLRLSERQVEVRMKINFINFVLTMRALHIRGIWCIVRSTF